MAFLNDFIHNYGITIFEAIITAIVGYLSIFLKNIYTKYINDKTKKDVVKTCVQAVEQIYTDIHGKEKLDKCIQYVSDVLTEKNISVTETEIYMMIESTVKQFNLGFNLTEN